MKDFELNLISTGNEHNCLIVWIFFGMPFFGTGIKTDLFQSCSYCWVFQICDTLSTALSQHHILRVWNSSMEIPSPPLALFVVMLAKTHLTSHSRMSGSRWVITPSGLSGSLRSFFWYSYSMYPCHRFLMSSANAGPIPFLSFIVLIFAWNAPKSDWSYSLQLSTTNWHLPRALPTTEQQSHLPFASSEIEPQAAIA